MDHGSLQILTDDDISTGIAVRSNTNVRLLRLLDASISAMLDWIWYLIKKLFSLILTVTSSLFSSSSSQRWKRKRRPPSHSKKFFYKKQSGIERLVLDKLDLRDFTLVRLSLRPPGEEFQLAFRRDGEWNPKAVTRCLKLRLLMPVSLGNLDLQWSPAGLVGAAVKLKF